MSRIASRVACIIPHPLGDGFKVEVREFNADDDVVNILYPSPIRHRTREDAGEDAKRLAERYSDCEYVVEGVPTEVIIESPDYHHCEDCPNCGIPRTGRR